MRELSICLHVSLVSGFFFSIYNITYLIYDIFNILYNNLNRKAAILIEIQELTQIHFHLKAERGGAKSPFCLIVPTTRQTSDWLVTVPKAPKPQNQIMITANAGGLRAGLERVEADVLTVLRNNNWAVETVGIP